MRLIAITGSIGCGKTTIANILRKQGYLVYDIDKWVKYIYYRRRFLDMIKSIFPEVFDGGIFNKRKLRNLVFSHPQKLKKLESLIHPILKKKFRNVVRCNRIHKFSDIVFVDIALLYEFGWDKYFDEIILADVNPEIQKKRVMARDHINEDDFNKINTIQIPREVKLKKADIILDTGVNIRVLERNIIDLVMEIAYGND